MKNILGTDNNLELFNKENKIVYKFYKNSDGFSYEYTYDSNGKILTYKNSDGLSWERTYDSNGEELTYKDSEGVTRGSYTFTINSFTFTFKYIGNFKIKK